MAELQTLNEEDKENLKPTRLIPANPENMASNDPQAKLDDSSLQLNSKVAPLQSNRVVPLVTLMTPRFRKNHATNQLITPSPTSASRQTPQSGEAMSSSDNCGAQSKYFLRKAKTRDYKERKDVEVPSTAKAGSRTPRKAPAGKEMPSFPDQLLAFLNTISRFRPDVVRWSSDGLSFFIDDKVPEISHLIATHFEHGNYQSLRRQLNVYGFAKMPRTSSVRAHWFHSYFQRDGGQQNFAKIVRKSRIRRSKSAKRKKSSASYRSERTKNLVQQTKVHTSSAALSRATRPSNHQCMEDRNLQSERSNRWEQAKEETDPKALSSSASTFACVDVDNRSPADSPVPYGVDKTIFSSLDTLVDVALGDPFPMPDFEFSPLVRMSEAQDVLSSSLTNASSGQGIRPNAIRPGVLPSPRPRTSTASFSTDRAHDDDSYSKHADDLIHERDFLQSPWESPTKLRNDFQGLIDTIRGQEEPCHSHPGCFAFDLRRWTNDTTQLTCAEDPFARRPLSLRDDNGIQAGLRLYSPMEIDSSVHNDVGSSCGSGRISPSCFFASDDTSPLSPISTPLPLESQSLTVQSSQTLVPNDSFGNDAIGSNAGTPNSVLSVLLPDIGHQFESSGRSHSCTPSHGTPDGDRNKQQWIIRRPVHE